MSNKNTRFKNQTSFQKEGYKRIFCDNCGSFLDESHLDDIKEKSIYCKCGTSKIISPPRVTTNKISEIITKFGSMECCTTGTPELTPE